MERIRRKRKPKAPTVRIRRKKKPAPKPTISPKTKSTIKKQAVQTAIEVLTNSVEPKFTNRPRKLTKYGIEKDPNNRYFKILLKVVEYLEETRGDNQNPIEYLLEDYFTIIYKRYDRMIGKTPFLNQLSPSITNKMEFDDFIASWEDKQNEDYFSSTVNIGKARSKARQLARKHQKLLRDGSAIKPEDVNVKVV